MPEDLHIAQRNLLSELRAKTGNRSNSPVSRVGQLGTTQRRTITIHPSIAVTSGRSGKRGSAPPQPAIASAFSLGAWPQCHLRLACNDVQVHYPVWCLDIGLADSPAQKWKTGRQPARGILVSWGMPQPPSRRAGQACPLREGGNVLKVRPSHGATFSSTQPEVEKKSLEASPVKQIPSPISHPWNPLIPSQASLPLAGWSP